MPLGGDRFTGIMWNTHCPEENTDCGYDMHTRSDTYIAHAHALYLQLWMLTCAFALAPPPGAGEELFLKGRPTFHPFVSVWKEKRRKSARKEWKRWREMPLSTQDVRLTMARDNKAAQNRPTLFLAAICSLSVFRQYLTCVKNTHIVRYYTFYMMF